MTSKEKESISEKLKKQTTQATEAVVFALSQTELFIDNSKITYARKKSNNVVWNLHSRQFKDWLISAFYENKKIILRKNIIDEVLSTLSGIARTKGDVRKVFVRVAALKGRYFLDLCQENNSKAVEIAEGICRIIDSPPVMFIRHDSMLALPEPNFLNISDINLLWSMCNVPIDSRVLVISYLIESLRPDTPFPILELIGEQGSAKSTTQAVLREIIDPSSCNLRAIPKTLDDLFVSASVNHIISYENVSVLSPTIQDGLCTIATGGGYAKRKLYLDAEEIVLYAKKPVILNGISPIVTASDLIDRTITLELPSIANRKEVQALWDEFNCNKGKILGALLMIFSQSLLKLPKIELPPIHRPRLLEFAYLGCAISEIISNRHTEFLEVFTNTRKEAVQRVLDGDIIAHAVIDWFEKNNRQTIELPLGALFDAVKRAEPTITNLSRTAKGFGAILRRLAPLLRQYGLNIKSLGKRGSNVLWHVSACNIS
jgi:hypothetical protein